MGVSVSIFTGMIMVKVTVESGKKAHFSLKLAVSEMRKKDTSKTPVSCARQTVASLMQA